MDRPIPRKPVPALRFELADGGTWRIEDQHPERFTMVVFYRGYHCPVCKKYLRRLTQLMDRYHDRGVGVVAVSMDDEERARRSIDEWELGDLPVGYGLDDESVLRWGLYMSHAIKESEPDLFSEPGLFLIEPDGTLYYGAVNTAPFGRPDLDEMLKSIDFVQENEYAARGEVAEPALVL